jgi:iron complex transport system permease protein
VKVARGLAMLAALLGLAIVARLWLGGAGAGWPGPEALRYRLFAAASGVGIGAALGISGLFLQVLLRNPLASPFILGISGGASLGYAIALLVAWRLGGAGAAPLGPVPAATLGAIVTVAIVWRFGTREGRIDPLTLVLAGAVVGAITGALTMAVQSLVPGSVRGDLVGWLMGRVPEAPDRGLLAFLAVLVVASAAIGTRAGRALDVATLSDDEATTLGLSLGRLRLVLFLLACTLTATTVALAGPIAFVGLVAPHAARIALGARHGPLVAGAAFAGAALLVAADAARQAIDLGGGRLPVGVVTAFLGGIAFLLILRKARWNP